MEDKKDPEESKWFICGCYRGFQGITKIKEHMKETGHSTNLPAPKPKAYFPSKPKSEASSTKSKSSFNEDAYALQLPERDPLPQRNARSKVDYKEVLNKYKDLDLGEEDEDSKVEYKYTYKVEKPVVINKRNTASLGKSKKSNVSEVKMKEEIKDEIKDEVNDEEVEVVAVKTDKKAPGRPSRAKTEIKYKEEEVDDDEESTSARRKKNIIDELDENYIDLVGGDSDSEEIDIEDQDVNTFDNTPRFIKGGLMRDYQVRGLNWIIDLYDKRINGILADEMGLGKTLQTIAFLGYLKYYRNCDGPHLVVCPKSCLSNWMDEFKRWCPSLKTICVIGHKEERKAYLQKIVRSGSKFDVLVTSYSMVLLEKSFMKQYGWLYLIIDEAHRIKNENCKLSEIVRDLKSANRLLLTGTPLQNNLHELWSLLNFLLPKTFKSSEEFDNWFNTNESKDDLSLVEKLHETLRPYLLRRIKSDVEKTLAPKKEMKIYVGITQMQRQLYRKILMKEIFISNVSGKPTKCRLLNVMMQLRKCTNHPYLFDGSEPGPPYTTDDHIVHNSGKMIVLDKLLTKLKAEGSRVVLFSQFTSMLDIIEDYLIWRGHKYCRLDGSTDHDDRAKGIRSFNAPNSEKFIYIISTRAGGLGINLATADIVVLYDSDWNPQVDLQAMDRCHRIGQLKEVRIFRLVCDSTIEEKMIERAEAKLRLDWLVIQQGRLSDPAAIAPNRDELSAIVKFGAENIIKTNIANSVLIDENIEDILDKSKQRTEEFNEKFEKLDENGLQNFTIEEPPQTESLTEMLAMPQINSFLFEGQDFRIMRDEKEKRGISVFQLRPRTRKPVYETQDLTDFKMMDKNYGPDRDFEPPESLKVAMKKKIMKTYDKLGRPPIPNPKQSTSKSANSNSVNTNKPTFNPFVPSAAQNTQRIYNPVLPQQIQFPSPRLYELYYHELDHYRQLTGYKPPKVNVKGMASLIARYEEDRLARSMQLPVQEVMEKITLKQESFSNWTMREVKAFIQGSEVFGIDNLEEICKFVNGKLPEEVIEYAMVFWERCYELEGFEDLLKKDVFQTIIADHWIRLKKLLSTKMNKVKSPRSLNIFYDPPNWKGRRFTTSQDQALLFGLHHLGLDEPHVFEKLYQNIKQSSDYDIFLKGRDIKEIRHRCILLLKLIEKENTKRRLAAINKVPYRVDAAPPLPAKFQSMMFNKGQFSATTNFQKPKPNTAMSNGHSLLKSSLQNGYGNKREHSLEEGNDDNDDDIQVVEQDQKPSEGVDDEKPIEIPKQNKRFKIFL